jgi:hydrogenase maturation protease
LKTLVLGLGNPILTDDAVAFFVVEQVRRKLDRENVTVCEASVGGLRLMELVAGYDRAIIIDAIQTEGRQPGEIHFLSPDELSGSLRSASAHDVSFGTALELGHRLGLDMPKEIIIIAVEVLEVGTFGEELTPAVAAAVPKVADSVLQELAEGSLDHRCLPFDSTFPTLLQ